MGNPEANSRLDASGARKLLSKHNFSFEALVFAPFPNASPLVRELLERGMLNDHQNPSEIIEVLMQMEGDAEATT